MIIFFGSFFVFLFFSLYEMSKLRVRPMRRCGLYAGKYGNHYHHQANFENSSPKFCVTPVFIQIFGGLKQNFCKSEQLMKFADILYAQKFQVLILSLTCVLLKGSTHTILINEDVVFPTRLEVCDVKKLAAVANSTDEFVLAHSLVLAIQVESYVNVILSVVAPSDLNGIRRQRSNCYTAICRRL